MTTTVNGQIQTKASKYYVFVALNKNILTIKGDKRNNYNNYALLFFVQKNKKK